MDEQVIPITVSQIERGIENHHVCCIDRVNVLCSLILKLLQLAPNSSLMDVL
jgi:hypothetical protein